MPAGGGSYLIADSSGFTRLAPDGTLTTLLAMLDDDPAMRFNDGKCDSAGRAWAGTVAHDLAPGAGTLYRLDPGPRATPIRSGLTVSNGLGWSPDGRTLWFADSSVPSVAGFDYDVATGELGACHVHVEVQVGHEGVPDGLTVDDDGCLWVAIWGGGAVHRYTPDGRLDAVVRVPASQVSSCTFGGSDRSTLFITTARVGLTPEALRSQPSAGGLFAVRPGVTGPAATPWHGDIPNEQGDTASDAAHRCR
jgi:sugar lactone lactonase YvrE